MKNNFFGKIKYIFFITFFLLLCLTGAFTLLAKPQTKYSQTERRALQKIPPLTQQTIASGTFMADFESFCQDQFICRHSFRKIKANFSKFIMNISDNHDFNLHDDYIFKLENFTNLYALNNNLKNFSAIYNQYLKNSNCKIYLSVIPDKNYFVTDKKIPKIDYEKILYQIKTQITFAKYIDIFPLLSLNDYYKTDQHWKQEKLIPVAEKIANEIDADIKTNFYHNELNKPFYGTYYGQAALSAKPDELFYFTCNEFANVKVTSYNTGSAKPSFIYDMSKAYDSDPYEIFLGGNDALLTIENPAVKNKKELIIFRDSFASSLAPLFISGYSKITLVDLRYLNFSLLPKFIDFNNQDVLFLYSTLVLNSVII